MAEPTEDVKTLYETAHIEAGDEGGKYPHALCPFCDDYVFFDENAEGIGGPIDNDCPHLVIHDGEEAKFLRGLTHEHWKYRETLLSSKRAINTDVNAVYAFGVDPKDVTSYMVKMTRDAQCERVFGFRSRDAAAWWCVEDMVKRARGVV